MSNPLYIQPSQVYQTTPMYMPAYQTQPCCCQQQDCSAANSRNMRPQYNAVNIELIEPHVKAPGYESLYNCPQGSVYNQPQVAYPYTMCPMPQYQVAGPQQPIPVQGPAPQQTPPVAPQAPQVPQQTPPASPQAPQAPQQPIPVPTQQEPQTMIPEAPQPQVVQNPTIVTPPVTQPTQQGNEQTPVVNEQPAVAKEEQIAGTQPQQATDTSIPQSPVAPMDLPTAVSSLKSDDLDQQVNTMENIFNTLVQSPEQGVPFLDTNVVNALVDILNKDTSKMEGPTPRQQVLREKLLNNEQMTPEEQEEAKQLSPMEAGERNKELALWTITMIQDSLNKNIEKTGGKVPLNELPAIDQVITTAKENPNTMLRARALKCLEQINRPEYSDVLNNVFEIAAKDDEDNNVREIAKEALASSSAMAASETNAATPNEQKQNVQQA